MQRLPIQAPALTWTKCQTFVSAPMWVPGPSMTAVGCTYASVIVCRMPRAVPKRPPRIDGELPVPRDLRGARPRRAHEGAGGELWHADVLDLLGRLADRSVDLVV